jgi:hypothetical protein
MLLVSNHTAAQQEAVPLLNLLLIAADAPVRVVFIIPI